MINNSAIKQLCEKLSMGHSVGLHFNIKCLRYLGHRLPVYTCSFILILHFILLINSKDKQYCKIISLLVAVKQWDILLMVTESLVSSVLLHCTVGTLFVLQVLTGCIQHVAPRPSRQAPQGTPWTSACPAPSFTCPKDPPVHLLGSTSLGPCLWPVMAGGSVTRWWVSGCNASWS